MSQTGRCWPVLDTLLALSAGFVLMFLEDFLPFHYHLQDFRLLLCPVADSGGINDIFQVWILRDEDGVALQVPDTPCDAFSDPSPAA